MRPRPRAFLIAACATSILLSGCKSRRDDSEAKSVSAFNYSNPADPKQSLLFIFPASARSFASAQNGGPGRNGAEPVVESTNAPITVADLMAGLKAGTMSKAVEALFPSSDPCKAPESDELVVFLECGGPMGDEYCEGKFRKLTKDQYICKLMANFKVQKFIPNFKTLDRMQAQIEALSRMSASDEGARSQIAPMMDIVKSVSAIMQAILDLESPSVIFMSQTEDRYQSMTSPFTGAGSFDGNATAGWMDIVGPEFDFSIDPTLYRCVGSEGSYSSHANLDTAFQASCGKCLKDYDMRLCRVRCSATPGGPITAERRQCR